MRKNGHGMARNIVHGKGTNDVLVEVEDSERLLAVDEDGLVRFAKRAEMRTNSLNLYTGASSPSRRTIILPFRK